MIATPERSYDFVVAARAVRLAATVDVSCVAARCEVIR